MRHIATKNSEHELDELHFVGFFFGFLLATCVGLLLLKAVYHAVVD